MISRASSMEAYPYSSKRKDGSELSLREWGMKAQSNYYGEKTKSRRHSASYIRSFNEETKSFRSSNITFSSATSSPAYPFKDHGIDPSTYSFNSAIKALQARSCYNSWECLSPDGFALNSKWNEAEKYICNPLSGEVPIECLSSKALISGRSFRKSLSNKVITIISEDHNDDPLVYSLRNAQTKTSSSTYYTQEEDDHDHEEALQYFPTIPEKKKEGMTRDVGIQSTSPYVSSSSPSLASTPSIIERSIKQVGDSPNSNAKTKSEEEEEAEEKDKETETEAEKMDDDLEKKDKEQICREGGCFPWIKKIKLKEKGRRRKINIFLTHC